MLSGDAHAGENKPQIQLEMTFVADFSYIIFPLAHAGSSNVVPMTLVAKQLMLQTTKSAMPAALSTHWYLDHRQGASVSLKVMMT